MSSVHRWSAAPPSCCGSPRRSPAKHSLPSHQNGENERIPSYLRCVIAERKEVHAIRQVAALPYKSDDDGKVRVLLITSRETRRWVLPKGNPIRGLASHEAAAHE